MTQQLDRRTDIKFEQNEKVVVIEINPQKVFEQHQNQFQKLDKIIVKHLDHQLNTCLEIFYGRNFLIISSIPARVQDDDQRIVMFTNNQNQLMDTQGIWIYLNKESLNLNIEYVETREETLLITQDKHPKKLIEFRLAKNSFPLKSLIKLYLTKKKQQNFILKRSFYSKTKLIYLIKMLRDQCLILISEGRSQIFIRRLDSSQRYKQRVKIKLNIEKEIGNAEQNGLDPLMTYLRLGQFNSKSAGPFNHYSSIHDHAGQFGIGKDLQGVIEIKIFSILSNTQYLMNPIQVLMCNKMI